MLSQYNLRGAIHVCGVKRILLALAFAFLLLAFPAFANERGVKRVETYATADRHALVIGNSAYTQTSPLRNPVNDAKSMTSSLQALGFTVTTLTDSNQRAMDQAIRKFGKTLRNQGGVGLFYYAGHGMQVDGENFLLPVDIDPSTEADVHYDAVPVGKLLGQMEAAGNGMNIVILDACRNNPFARSFRSASKGLAQVSAPSGTFISYATGPGKVAADGEGENGLFTEKLVAHLATPGLKLEEVFKRVRVDVQRESMGKQVPWDSSSVTGDFFFVRGNPPSVPPLAKGGWGGFLKIPAAGNPDGPASLAALAPTLHDRAAGRGGWRILLEMRDCRGSLHSGRVVLDHRTSLRHATPHGRRAAATGRHHQVRPAVLLAHESLPGQR